MAPAGTDDQQWFGEWVDARLSVAMLFVHGRELSAVLDALHADSSRARVMTFDDADAQSVDSEAPPLVRVGQAAGWIYSIESRTGRGVGWDLITVLSAQGREACSMSYGMSAAWFAYAGDSAHLLGFDMTLPEIAPEGTRAGELAGAIAEAGFFATDYPERRSAGARLVRRLLGITLTPAMLDGPLPAYPLLPFS